MSGLLGLGRRSGEPATRVLVGGLHRRRDVAGQLAQPPHPRRRPREGLAGVRRAPRDARRLSRDPRLPGRRSPRSTSPSSRAVTRRDRPGAAGAATWRSSIVFAVACGLLSWWQWSRRAEAVAEIDRVDGQLRRAAGRRSTTCCPTLDSWDDRRRVAAGRSSAGSYLADEQLLVRNRPYNGASGFEVLVPFQLDDGRVFVVDRGWLPVGSSIEAPDAVPAPPDGEVTVVARLKPGEPELPGRTAPEGQLATIHLPSVAALTGDRDLHRRLRAAGERGSRAGRAASGAGAEAGRRRGAAPVVRAAVDRVRRARVRGAVLGVPARAAHRGPPGERAGGRARAEAAQSADSDYEDAVLDRR